MNGLRHRQEGVLQNVLCVFGVLAKLHPEAINAILVPEQEGLEGVLIPRAGRFQEGSVVLNH